jgi:hypothetical protein
MQVSGAKDKCRFKKAGFGLDLKVGFIPVQNERQHEATTKRKKTSAVGAEASGALGQSPSRSHQHRS